jgi:transposase
VRRLGCSGRGARSLTWLSLLGVSQQTLRKWSKQEQADRGERHDTLTSAERDELRRLRRENVGLKQERDVLKRATALFARETETR